MRKRTGPRQHLARARLGATAIFLVLAAPTAEAALPPLAQPSEIEPVVLSAPRCKAVPFSVAPFVDSLRVELSESGLRCCMLARPDDGAPKAGSLFVDVEIVPCAPGADVVHVSVRDPVDSLTIERDLSWADVAESARPRATALAVAELIGSLRRSPPPARPEVVPVPAPVPEPASVSAPPSPPRESRGPIIFSLHLEAEARSFPSRDTLAWGGRLRGTSHFGAFHLDLDVGANYARAHDDLGDVLVRGASVGLGVGPRLQALGLIIDPGLRAELGWAWASGEPARANVRAETGSWLTSSVGARLALEAPARLKVRPGLILEGGAVLSGIDGEVSKRRLVGLAGYYALVAVALGVSL